MSNQSTRSNHTRAFAEILTGVLSDPFGSCMKRWSSKHHLSDLVIVILFFLEAKCDL